MLSILSNHLVLQTSLSLCFKDSWQHSIILSSRQFLRGTNKLKKYEISLLLVIKFRTCCSPQEATTARFKQQQEQCVKSALGFTLSTCADNPWFLPASAPAPS